MHFNLANATAAHIDEQTQQPLPKNIFKNALSSIQHTYAHTNALNCSLRCSVALTYVCFRIHVTNCAKCVCVCVWVHMCGCCCRLCCQQLHFRFFSIVFLLPFVVANDSTFYFTILFSSTCLRFC